MIGSATSILPPAVRGDAAGHLPPEAAQSAPAAFPSPAAAASPFCASARFHMVDRQGRRLACADCPPPCPACRGRGWRIVTDDGTRPACISCEGSGWIRAEARHD